jgi:hypothetical protein
MSDGTPGGAFFSAVLSVREMFRAVVEEYARVEATGDKPAAEKWTSSERHSAAVFDRVSERWAELTGMEAWQFPFSRNAVRWAWLTYRKGSGDRGEMHRWIGLPDGFVPSMF